MKIIAIGAAALLAASVMHAEAGPLENWKPGNQIKTCFPNWRLPDERPQDCILTAHPLSSDTHGGGPKDTMELKWHIEKDQVEHHKPTAAQ